MIQEFQHSMESELISVMNMKMPLISESPAWVAFARMRSVTSRFQSVRAPELSETSLFPLAALLSATISLRVWGRMNIYISWELVFSMRSGASH